MLPRFHCFTAYGSKFWSSFVSRYYAKRMTKRKYGTWTEMEMGMAIAAHRNGDMGFNECCRHYNIPKPILKRHLDNKNVRANETVKVGGDTTTLPPEVDHIFKLEKLLFGFTITNVPKLAYQIAEQNGIPHNFNRNTEMPGKKWFYAFKICHKDL